MHQKFIIFVIKDQNDLEISNVNHSKCININIQINCYIIILVFKNLDSKKITRLKKNTIFTISLIKK